jgi:biopolymer transport protein ExbB/biopolymer transport protein TolQ
MIVDRLLRIALVGSSWVLYLLLALSVVSFAAMFERWLYFRRHRDDLAGLRAKLKRALREGDLPAAEALLAASPSIEARVLRAALLWSDGGAEAVSDAIDSESSEARKDLERGMTLLGTLGNNAPFIGLFGTVLGVIEAFHQLGDGANKAAMGNVMGGIAEALVATGVGLFVALPAVVAFNVAQKRIGEIESGVANMGKLITAFLKTRKDVERQSLPGEHEQGEHEGSAGVKRAGMKAATGNGAAAAAS